MRQLFAVASVVGVLGLGTPAEAAERSWYMALDAGIETDGDAYGTDWGFGGFAAVGREVTSHLNVELEFGYRSTTDDGYDIDQTSLMLNAIYEVPVTEDVSLSLGLGLGADRVRVGIDVPGFSWSDSEVEFASQLVLGANWEVSEGTDLLARFRYMETVTASAIDNATLTIGVRFEL
jgi:opacity protein-like surface antigen